MRPHFSALCAALFLAAALPAEDRVRLEHEDKLELPPAQAEALWQHMQKGFVEEGTALAALGPGWKAHSAVERFWDTYYDSPDRALLRQGHGLRHRRRLNESDPEHRKSGRELVQLKLSDQASLLVRSERKYSLRKESLGLAEDGPPLPKLLKRKQWALLQADLQALGFDSASLEPVLTLEQERRRVYVEKDGKPVLSLSLDRVTPKWPTADAALVELEPELNEVGYTEAPEGERRAMEAVAEGLVKDLQAAFPRLKRDLTPKYMKMHRLLFP